MTHVIYRISGHVFYLNNLHMCLYCKVVYEILRKQEI